MICAKQLPNMCSDQQCATLDYHLQKSLDDNAESHDYLGHLDMLTESSLSSHLVMTMALCYPRTYQVHVFMILLTALKCEHLSTAHPLQQPAMTSPVYFTTCICKCLEGGVGAWNMVTLIPLRSVSNRLRVQQSIPVWLAGPKVASQDRST